MKEINRKDALIILDNHEEYKVGRIEEILRIYKSKDLKLEKEEELRKEVKRRKRIINILKRAIEERKVLENI